MLRSSATPRAPSHGCALSPGSTVGSGCSVPCSGGRQTFLYACHNNSINSACELWGGRVVMSKEELNPKQPVAPIEYTQKLSCPLLGLFRQRGPGADPGTSRPARSRIKKYGKQYEFHRYDGAGHGFFYYDRPAYRIEQALERLAEGIRVFAQALGRITPGCARRSSRSLVRLAPARLATGGSS